MVHGARIFAVCVLLTSVCAANDHFYFAAAAAVAVTGQNFASVLVLYHLVRDRSLAVV